MSIRRCPDDATLMGYAAGALSEPFAILVGAHADLCPACRRTLRTMAAIGGAMFEAAPAAAPEAGAFDRLLQRVAAPRDPVAAARLLPPPPLSDLPAPLARLVGGGLADLEWRNVLPGGDESLFTFPSRRGLHTLRFVRGVPGRDIPEHSHPGPEITLVLQGVLRDGPRDFAAGDVCEADVEVTHHPVVVGDDVCVCVIAEEGAPRFVGADMAALQKRLGI